MSARTTQRFALRGVRPTGVRGFTLLELLVVLAIIGLILALSLPNFRHMSEGKVMEGAVRQLLDDLAFARQTAIATRGIVAVVFVPPDLLDSNVIDPSREPKAMAKIIRDLQGGVLTHYALFAFRQAGEQPGRGTKRYLTPWRGLPEKTFVAEWKFDLNRPDGFWRRNFPFPVATNRTQLLLPYVAFNPQGQCVRMDATAPVGEISGDPFIPLASGVVLYTRDNNDNVVNFTVQEIPRGSSATNQSTAHVIYVDALTGRAKYVRQDVVASR